MNARPGFLSKALNGALDLVYPPKCLVCETLGREILCARCREGFRSIPRPICSRCGTSRENHSCRKCLMHPVEHISCARSAGVFEGPLRKAIHKLKYAGRRRLAAPLGGFLAEFLRERPFGSERFDFMAPIPLHDSRLREREFNQACLIAVECGSILSLPVVEQCVRRVRPTRPQVDLHAADRAANMKGAFRCIDAQSAAGMRILLVDDVATTLSTADACAASLIEGGARSVSLATIAREI